MADGFTDQDDLETATPGTSYVDLHEEAILRFDDITKAVQEERALGLGDRRFVSIAGAQWEGGWAQQFQNSIMVEINKTAAGVEKIIADYRANRMIVDFRAVGKDASEQTAETLNGLFRADFYWSKGQQATDNAFEEAVMGGIGAWRLRADYEDELDPENDSQRIRFEMIGDADQSVFWDMNARLYDKSDARFCFVVTAMSRDAFTEEYGADRVCDWPDEILKPYYDWYTPDVVRVADYYWYDEKPGLLRILRHKATGEERRMWADEIERDELARLKVEGWVQDRTRRAKRRTVKKCVLSGCEVLVKPQEIAGDCIPVIPVYGKRWFVDNMERSRGHVRLAKDPQRVYNGQISKLTETAAITPIERPIFTPEQIAGHEQSWAEANLNRSPYSLLNPIVGPDGSPVPAGPIGKVEPPTLAPVLAALIQITANDINELTSADDGADQAKANISAEAMDIAATRTDAKAETYMDNMRQSWQRCGEVYLSMARAIYWEDGREVETMGANGELDTATLNDPFTDEQGRFQIRNDLSRGKYNVIADVTEATATRRDKTVKTLLNAATIAAPTDPDLSAVCLSTALINMDGEGMHDLQDYLRAKLVAQGAVKPTDEEKQQLEAAQAAQQNKPDPATVLALAQAQGIGAQAQKDVALAGKAQADTILSHAKAVQTLAGAHHDNALANKTEAETHGAHAGAHKTLAEAAATLAPEQPAPAPGGALGGAGGDPGVTGAAPVAPQAATVRRIGIFNALRNMVRGKGDIT